LPTELQGIGAVGFGPHQRVAKCTSVSKYPQALLWTEEIVFGFAFWPVFWLETVGATRLRNRGRRIRRPMKHLKKTEKWFVEGMGNTGPH
ncbi:MAG: hypothetical protein AAFU85_22980, partial [Planctomycetota bacterium]